MVNVMLVFTVLLVLSFSSLNEARPTAQQYAQFFSRWLSSRNATYTSDVFQRRFEAYKRNMDLVDDHNDRFRAGLETFTMALNQWADLTESEYRAKLGFIDHSAVHVANNQPAAPSTSQRASSPAPIMLGDPISDALCKRFGLLCRSSSTGVAQPSSAAPAARSSSSSTAAAVPRSSSAAPSVSSVPAARSSSSSTVPAARPSSSSSAAARLSSSSTASAVGAARSSSTGAPASGSTNVDWRQYGYVGPVKDQGQCGSCWTFASTAVMEAAWAMKTGQLLSFSEQELLDCAANGARTCQTGGAMQDSWNYLIGSGSTRRSPMTSSSYPYTASSAASCLYDSSRATNAVFSSKVYVRSTEADLLTASRSFPAIAVAMHGSGRAFQFYSSGILSDSSCLSTNPDHAVVVVGYGTDAATGFDYWLVRNSWGTQWGDSGYAKIRRNFNNMCGMATQPSYVTA